MHLFSLSTVAHRFLDPQQLLAISVGALLQGAARVLVNSNYIKTYILHSCVHPESGATGMKAMEDSLLDGESRSVIPLKTTDLIKKLH
jgi:hypothetical protein